MRQSQLGIKFHVKSLRQFWIHVEQLLHDLAQRLLELGNVIDVDRLDFVRRVVLDAKLKVQCCRRS